MSGYITTDEAARIVSAELGDGSYKSVLADYGMFATLEVQLPRGLFTVEPFFQTGSVDMKKISIELFRAARKRLPR